MGFLNQFKTSLILFICLTVVTGIIYPLLITGLAQLFFPWQANGSLLEKDGRVIGSHLIGQYFNEDQYFWGRPSATDKHPYNAESSSGSNQSLLNPDFTKAVQERTEKLLQSDPDNHQPIPIDLVTASGSGLDPHISPASAFYQIHRVARARGLSEDKLRKFVERMIEKRVLRILGEPRINVLHLNLALDEFSKKKE